MSTEALPLLRRGPFCMVHAGPAGDDDSRRIRKKIREGYRHWQPRILLASTIGYAVYYFVRVNLPVAMPAMEKNLHITKTSLGLFLTLHGVIYGVSKFLNGFLGDRANARTFMATGLFLSALVNFAFGSASLTIWSRNFLAHQRLLPGNGIPAVRAPADALVSAAQARDENVDLEYFPPGRRFCDHDPLRIPRREIRLALLLLHPGVHRDDHVDLSTGLSARHAGIARIAAGGEIGGGGSL